METGVDVVTDKESIPPLETVNVGLVKKENMPEELQARVEQALGLARKVLGEPEVVFNPKYPDWPMVNSRTAYIPELKAHIMHIMSGGGRSCKDGAALYNGTQIITPDVVLKTTNVTDQEHLGKYGSVTVLAPPSSKMVQRVSFEYLVVDQDLDKSASIADMEKQTSERVANATTGVNKILAVLQKITTSSQ